MFVKDPFLHACYVKSCRTGKRCSFKKDIVLEYEEMDGGTKMFTSRGDFTITMSYEEVQKALQVTVC